MTVIEREHHDGERGDAGPMTVRRDERRCDGSDDERNGVRRL